MVAVDRGRFGCLVAGRPVLAMRARELGRRAVVVGDRVRIVGDTSGHTGSLARIVEVASRRSVLRRSADDNDPQERVVVANAEQLVVVSAVEHPAPRIGFIDRCLVAAFDGGIEALLCLTKTDLPDTAQAAADLAASYAALALPTIACRHDEDPAQLRQRLAGRISVLIGQSGVGKSTLVNRLVPDAERTVGQVNAVTGRGRHISSSAVALPLPGGGWVLDTPGLRSFGLAHVEPDRLLAAFPDLQPGAAGCPSGCRHRDGGCALDGWVRAGRATPARLASYRRLLQSRDRPI